MSKYMYEHTKMPPYLPMPRFLLNCPISNTAKMLYVRLLGKAQLSQKNQWMDGQGRVYFIYTSYFSIAAACYSGCSGNHI